MWKLTRPGNQHDKLVRDTLLDLQDHRLVRIELVREDQRQVWVLTKRGHGEAKKLLEPKGIRVSALREEKYDPVTGKLLGAGYDDHSAAVTSTAAELHRAGIGHRLGFATEIPHRLAGGYVQRADLVVRAPAAGVPVMLLEIDRRTEDAHDLVAKLRRYWEWARLLPRDADKHTVDLVRSRLDAIDQLVDHEKRLWRRVYPPTDREGLVPVAFVFADTTEAKVANTVAVLEEAGRRYWGAAPVRDLLRRGDHGEGLQPGRAGRRHHPGATHGARRRRGGVAAPGAQGRTDPDRRARQSRRRRSLPPSVRPRRNGGRAAPCR
ncbi:replication-relaxation family protein [Streptomyces sp. YIM B13508]|uniref:replication-relaxation family protein n=1 Tax=Streptomyces sp. YIM B13508 TaxID=3366315 RepID=UPI0036B4491D